MKLNLCIILLSAACSSMKGAPVTSNTLSSALAGSSPTANCYDPANYGAVPGDGIDDRVPIQAAIDAALAAGGGDVCLGVGVYDTPTRAPFGSYDRFAILSWHGGPINFHGAGKLSTTIRASGDQGNGGTWVFSLDPGAHDSTVTDLTVDTSGMVNTDEQTHVIEIGSGLCSTINGTCSLPVANITVQRVRFIHPGNVPTRKGDCVRLLGNTPATQTKNIKLLDLDFLSCARSGVGLQRNANAVTVSRSYFNGDAIGGTMLDGEATGGSSTGLIVEADTFVRTLPGGDTYGLTLTSQSDYVVKGNLLAGRGMFIYRSDHGTISGNVVDDVAQAASTGSIDVENTSKSVSINTNSVHRTGAVGSAIKVTHHSGGFPGPVSIGDNVLDNETDGIGIQYVGSATGDSSIGGNAITLHGTPNGIGIYVFPAGANVEGLAIGLNVIRGALYAAVRLGATGGFGFVGTVVGLNTSRASGPGLRCDNPTFDPAGGIVRGLNNWSTPELCTAP